MQEHARRSARARGSRRGPARPERRSSGPRETHLLALQRAAGNRAVAQRVDDEIDEEDYTARAERKLRDNDLYASHEQVSAAVRTQFDEGDEEEASAGLSQRAEILDDAAFEQRLQDYSNGIDPHTGEQWTDERIGEVRGYIDRSESPATVVMRSGDDTASMLHVAIHEGMHVLSHDSWRSEAPWRLNEGATEHFSRKVGRAHGLDAGWRYDREVESVERLQSAVGRDPIVDGYFAGTTSSLIRAVGGLGWASGRSPLTDNSLYRDWHQAISEEDLDEADRLLADPGPPEAAETDTADGD